MARHQQIYNALCANPRALSPQALALGHAVWRVPLPAESHANCLAQLPTLVQADLAGDRDSTLNGARRHLVLCNSCVKMYIDLLELAELDQRDALPDPGQIPQPNLDFLESTDG